MNSVKVFGDIWMPGDFRPKVYFPENKKLTCFVQRQCELRRIQVTVTVEVKFIVEYMPELCEGQYMSAFIQYRVS